MERKIYLYDRGFWVLFRMLGVFAAALSLFLTLCFIMWIREWAFLLAILAGIVATVALLMHKAAVCGACRWAVDRRGSVRAGRKDVSAGCVPVCVSVYKHEALGNRCAEQKTADGGANPRAVPAESGEQAE